MARILAGKNKLLKLATRGLLRRNIGSQGDRAVPDSLFSRAPWFCERSMHRLRLLRFRKFVVAFSIDEAASQWAFR
ncbi:hypothetical protein [Paraburkholderia megapolitana]|uniref:hypothetical protein n=1 Tax=Paraburkholderia megapolitana TaxID=420953 RepID=UPI000B841F0C|nr:hypothetical protein [Paraburkholderia megapolitana]QDQ83581.1 hypothetical protein FNZ07_20615 [Paraburkholderia megapolitana]